MYKYQLFFNISINIYFQCFRISVPNNLKLFRGRCYQLINKCRFFLRRLLDSKYIHKLVKECDLIHKCQSSMLRGLVKDRLIWYKYRCQIMIKWEINNTLICKLKPCNYFLKFITKDKIFSKT